MLRETGVKSNHYWSGMSKITKVKSDRSQKCQLTAVKQWESDRYRSKLKSVSCRKRHELKLESNNFKSDMSKLTEVISDRSQNLQVDQQDLKRGRYQKWQMSNVTDVKQSKVIDIGQKWQVSKHIFCSLIIPRLAISPTRNLGLKRALKGYNRRCGMGVQYIVQIKRSDLSWLVICA